MKGKTHFSLVLILLYCSIVFGQQTDLPVPELIADFAVTGNNCEYAMALTDHFIRRLNDDPNTQGHAVIYGDPRGASISKGRAKRLRNQLSARGIDRSRVTITHAPVRNSAVVQLWIVPAGALGPEILPANAEFQPKKPITDAYIWAIDSVDGLPECRQAFDLEEFAGILNADETLRGNIVVRETSVARYRRKERAITGTLAKNGVSRARLRSFFVKVPPNQLLDYAELWLVPTKKR